MALAEHHHHGSNPPPGEATRPRVFRCLTIAGSDCGGGAGIQADLKTFAARGVFGMSAITAITVQNTTGVSGVMPVPAETIKAQIESVLSDLGADAIKIGMLGSKEAIDAVTSSLARFYSADAGAEASGESSDDASALPPSQMRRELPPIVLDSVMVAKGGQPLLDQSAIAHLPEVLRFACLVTPNIPEAVLLLKHLDPAAKQEKTMQQEREVTTVQHTREVAAELAECLRVYYGYKGAVLVKGGHLKEMAREKADDDDDEEELATVVDVLCDGHGRLFEYASQRIHTRSTHGTGCTLSSAIAAELARGRDLERAVSKAVRYVHGAIVHAPAPDDATPATALPALPSTAALGSGHGPLDHMWKLKPLLKSSPASRSEQAAVADFGAELWGSIEEVFAKIIAHPFIQGLTSGDLPEDVFKFYIIQDMHYLREYSRILALLAAKADNNAGMLLFLESAKSIVGGECAMHLQFCREWGLDADDLASILEAHPASPTNMLYTSYMLRVGFDRPYYEGVAAVLPCAWIYNEVGNYLKSKGSPHPQYARWIETYGSEDFSTTTKSLIDITTRVAAGLGDDQRRRMRECFVQTSKFEFMFWDMAHTKQTFPI